MATLAQLKAQVNQTGTDDDTLLTRLLTAAVAHTSNQIGSANPLLTTPEVEQAVLMLAAHWYENRETTIVGTIIAPVPMGYDAIIDNCRDYTFGLSDE